MHRHENVLKCLEILDLKIKEYIQTHDEWHGKGYLCPHTGDPEAHKVMDEIIEDVEQAHEMLEAALYAAGLSYEEMHKHTHKAEPPTHVGAPGMRKVPS